MGSRVELFEQIRRDRDREGLSIRELARRHAVHRRAVRQALASPLPPERKRPEGRPAVKLGGYRELIDSWLVADREAPRKQRHTARRVWQRLVEEHGAEVGESTVRDYVRARRRELCPPSEAFVPQCHDPGSEAEVDWGEAQVVLRGQPTKVHLFHMRACHSGAGFCMAFLRETQQAFLEAHVEAFRFFGGVFCLVRYDNLSAAVKKVLRGRRREESDRFVALRSHYLFDSQFTLVGLEGAHEKGGVEGEVGRFRRRHLVPVPAVDSLAELNERLEDGFLRDLGRRIAGREETVELALRRESRELRALPIEDFDSCEEATPRVDQKALVTVRQNRYSVPVGLVGMRVRARIGAREVVCLHDGGPVASHERLEGRFGVSARLDHYLELLARKPGALRGSVALRQERERGGWPKSFDELWQALEQRRGASEAARQMVDVLLLCRELSPAWVELAVRGALAAGAIDGRAVGLLARRAERPEPMALELEERLREVGTPEPNVSDYDILLGGGGAGR
ncbi:MAG: IS21 family transposase [Actinobacteria bacterium]|nr:IS21 family transposase [Actinomycetota bacterium]